MSPWPVNIISSDFSRRFLVYSDSWRRRGLCPLTTAPDCRPPSQFSRAHFATLDGPSLYTGRSVPTDKRATPGPAGSRSTDGAAYSGVSVVSSGDCCEAAKELAGRKLLTAEAPRLPLADCTQPMQCKCRFRKFTDRRDGDEDRRHLGSAARSVWYAGPQRRESPKRRRGD